MDIDMAALRALEREREIPMDVIVPAIEQALLLAYQKEEGSYRRARVELDRRTGHVVVWAREDGEKCRLAAPVGAEERGDLARLGIQAHVVNDRGAFAVGDAHIIR